MSERAIIYAMLSKFFADILDEKTIEDLKSNTELLNLIGQNTKNWFENSKDEELLEEINIDFTTIFLMNAQPIESSVIDNKNDVLVGLQNPVMQFYFSHGYDINLLKTHIQTPDHLAIELAFMQNLVMKEELKTQKRFLKKHLLEWVPQYLIGIKNIAQTPFYRDLCDFASEFIVADYHSILELTNESE